MEYRRTKQTGNPKGATKKDMPKTPGISMISMINPDKMLDISTGTELGTRMQDIKTGDDRERQDTIKRRCKTDYVVI